MHIFGLTVIFFGALYAGNLIGWHLRGESHFKDWQSYTKIRSKVLDDLAEQVKEASNGPAPRS